jgi:tRNA modification GTPase
LRQHTSDFIEQHGMERTRKELAQADVILEVVDGSKPQSEAHRVPIPAGREKAHVLILNKADLGAHDTWHGVPAVALSCASAEGVESLRHAMRDAVWSGAVSGNAQLVAINARHKACFERAAAALREAADTFRAGTGTEFVALHVREAMQAVGEVTGRVDVEEVLGAIFSTFCIGK